MKAGKVEKEKVIFRVFPEGDVIAMFPRIAVDTTGYKCQSYMHVGQHGAADPMIVSSTRLATVIERANLRRELEQLGYDLKLVKRFTSADQEYRKSVYA